jgi:menaquinone-dependent protoporphyrinogen oxidase
MKMKTLIVYASKHGCAERCSELLRERLKGEVVTVDIQKDRVPDVALFDKVIIGGSIYVGKIQKEITEFCHKYLDVLKEKKLGLFICCMLKKNEEIQLNSVFPEELSKCAVSRECFGGEFRFGKMNALERLAVKMVSKSEGNLKVDGKKDVSMLSQDVIDKFAEQINKA